MDVRDSGMAAVLQDLLPNNWVGQGLLRGERGLAVATRSRCSMPPIRSFEVDYPVLASPAKNDLELASG